MRHPDRASNGNAKQPLWRKLRDDLRMRIDRGDFNDGVPGELALAREYDVSRATVRAALAPLRREGAVSSHRGRPSAVVNVAGDHHFGPIYSLFAAVEDAGMVQRSTVDAAERRINADVADRLELASGAELGFIRRTRFADDDVIAVDETWLRGDIADDVLEADLSHTALYQVLRDLSGITLDSGRETLHAITTDSRQSTSLACPIGTAAFFIERLGMAGGKPVEWRETLIRGDRFTVTTSYPTVSDPAARTASGRTTP